MGVDLCYGVVVHFHADAGGDHSVHTGFVAVVEVFSNQIIACYFPSWC